MVRSNIEELQAMLGALARQLDDEDKEEANKIAQVLAPGLAMESNRVKNHMKELIEADGSQRDARMWVPLPWREEGLRFPWTESEAVLYAGICGVLWCFAVRERLYSPPRELWPLMVKAIKAKESTFREYAQMINRYWEPALRWLPDFINHGAGALAGHFKQTKLGPVLLADSIAEVLKRLGLEAAISARDSLYKEKGSPYQVALEVWQEVIDSTTCEGCIPPPSAVAEILVASIEANLRMSATFLKELAQRDSKARHTLENTIVISMMRYCEQLEVEFSLSGEVTVDEDLKSMTGFDMRRALAREIILDSKRQKESIAKLCQEAGLERRFVQTFGEETGLLKKWGRPRKVD